MREDAEAAPETSQSSDLRSSGARRRALAVHERMAALPRSADEWTALVKVGSGEHDIAPRELARLSTLGLVEHKAGLPVLTRRGRYTLGLPD